MSKVLQFLTVLFSFIVLITPQKALGASWYFPVDRYYMRQTVKGFGQLIDGNFYKGKERLFPFNRFYGYHAAVDLEVFADEKNQNIPVYAIYSGRILYFGLLEGYGGVILQEIENENRTALYGHVKIKNLKHQVGDKVSPGGVITFLGDEFSSETSKERKHLHFGILKGTGLYFSGHEVSLERLLAKWEDPNSYLKNKGAISQPVLSSKSESVIVKKDVGFWDFLVENIKAFLKKLGL